MGKGRIEAFSDGVIAIIITVMVLELKVPEDTSLAGLMRVTPHILIYVLSFIYVGIYWNNHHHMFQAVRSVTGAILWANLHLLFWLSLVPFASAWMGESGFAALPVALYGGNLLMAAAAYAILMRLLVVHEGRESAMGRAIGKDRKTQWSLLGYAAAIAVAPFLPLLSVAVYAGVALAWLVPDPRIERGLKSY